MSEYIMTLRKYVGHMPLLQCGASVILINEKGEILLQKRRDNGCWGLHGGSVEPDEAVEDAAGRELYEETGLAAARLELFGVFSGPGLRYEYPNGDIVSNVDIVYLCREYSGSLKPNLSEVSELRFFRPDEIPENISPPQQKPLRAYIGAFATGAKIEIAVIPYESKYKDDMLFCFLAAKDAVGRYAPDPRWGKPALKEDLLDIEKHYFERGDVFYLAVDGRDRVAGMVGTQTAPPGDLWLKRLFVKPELKGKGIGGKLLSAVEGYARGKGITAIHTRFAEWYREAAVFYPAKGFSDAGAEGYLRHMVKRLS